MEKEKKFRQISTLENWLKMKNAGDHQLIKCEHSIHVIIARDSKTIVKSKHCRLGGRNGGFSEESAQELLDFINQ